MASRRRSTHLRTNSPLLRPTRRRPTRTARGYNLDIKNPHTVAQDHGDPEHYLLEKLGEVSNRPRPRYHKIFPTYFAQNDEFTRTDNMV